MGTTDRRADGLAGFEREALGLERAATLARRDKRIGREAQIFAYGLAAELRYHHQPWILYSVRMAALCCGLSETKVLEAADELIESGVIVRQWGYGTWTYRKGNDRPYKRVRRDHLQVLAYAELLAMFGPHVAHNHDLEVETFGTALTSPHSSENSLSFEKSPRVSTVGSPTSVAGDALSGYHRTYTLPSEDQAESFETQIWPHLDCFRQGYRDSLGRAGWWVLCEIAAGKSTTEELARVVPYSRSSITRVVTRMEQLGMIDVDGQRYRSVTAVRLVPQDYEAALTKFSKQEAERQTLLAWAHALAQAGVSNRRVSGLIARELQATSQKCEECGSQGQEVHHILPRFLGGSDTPDNLSVLCRDCHNEVTAEWRLKALWPLEPGKYMINLSELAQALSDQGDVRGALTRFQYRAIMDATWALDMVRQLTQDARQEGIDLPISPLLDLIANEFATEGPEARGAA